MKIETVTKSPFSVIGKEGSSDDGPGFIQRLWRDANEHFDEVAHLAERDENGVPVGFWGAMTDFSRSFQPWEADFSQGLYLAGVECRADAQPPQGWTRWDIPGFVCLKAACGSPALFADMLAHLQARDLPLAGAVQDYTDPKTGDSYMLFPVRRLP